MTQGVAATKLLLRDFTSSLGKVATAGAGYGCAVGTNDHLLRLASTTQGSSAVTKTFAPSGTNPPCQAQTASGNGEYLVWVSPPLSAAVTISGNINYQVGCSESASNLNVGLRFIVYRWSVDRGGIISIVQTSASTTECGTTAANRTIAAAAPTSTSFSVGDRIYILLEISATAGWGGNSSRTISAVYDAAASAVGDAYVNFVDNISFSADSPNGRAKTQ